MKSLLSVIVLVVAVSIFASDFAGAAAGRAKNFNLVANISEIDGSSFVATSSNGTGIAIDVTNAQIIKNGKKNLDVGALVAGDHVTVSGKIMPDGSYVAQHVKVTKILVKAVPPKTSKVAKVAPKTSAKKPTPKKAVPAPKAKSPQPKR